jgi:hypothetical protein
VPVLSFARVLGDQPLPNSSQSSPLESSYLYLGLHYSLTMRFPRNNLV